MKYHATAVFKNTLHDRVPYGDDDDSTLARMHIEREFEGDLAGKGTAELLVCQPNADSFSYVGTDRFSGRLGDRSGSFVFQHGGKHNKGVLDTFGYVVPGSGKEGMEGMVGDLKISVTAEGHMLDLDYDFED